MPTYNALGISATLTVADLQSSLSNVVDFKQGAEQRNDAQRINNVFAAGRKLPERPIGADGGEKGVQQFLGPQEDLAFFMVEVGDNKRRWKEANLSASDLGMTAVELAEDQGSVRAPATDSPLTSLGRTPSVGTPVCEARESPVPFTSPPRSDSKRKTETPKSATPRACPDFEKARSYLDSKSGPEALCLTLDICHKTFLPRNDCKTKTTGKDLKLEVFLNGQLVGCSLINRRGSSIEIVDNRVSFHGVRVHRQVEKPWVYDATASGADFGMSSDRRWSAVRQALKREVAARGQNKLGDFAPSTELLKALSKLHLPERLQGSKGLSVIDLVITAGTGKKYGPENGYLTGPTRMDDPQYNTFKRADLDDPFADDIFSLEKEAEDASPLRRRAAPVTPQSQSVAVDSPGPSCARRRNAEASPRTPSKQKSVDLNMGLDLEKIDLKRKVEPFENAHGKSSTPRTLKQRLGDLRQMSPKNREKHLAALREELGEEAIRAVKKAITVGQPLEKSPSKKVRLTPQGRSDFGLNLLADAAFAGAATIEPTKLFENAPLPSMLPEGAEPDAVLTQNRVDMALEAGAAFSGPLLRHIASTSPQRTPQRRTRASALANSPCSIPVKEPLQQKKQPTTPSKQNGAIFYYPDGSPIPIDPALTGPPPSMRKTTGLGANRTARAWNPYEKTANDVLKEFRNPEMCKGSVVSYAEDPKVQRQIGKARRGEFREESLVVGMRFVVV